MAARAPQKALAPQPKADRRRIPVVASTVSALLISISSGCATAPKKQPTHRPCIPQCKKNASCGVLDERLVSARQPLLKCVGEQAHRGHLNRAHRCYRALRLIESARWWLRTLTADDVLIPPIYRGPVETVQMEFLCRIERLSKATTPAQVERLYLEMVRSYP